MIYLFLVIRIFTKKKQPIQDIAQDIATHVHVYCSINSAALLYLMNMMLFSSVVHK